MAAGSRQTKLLSWALVVSAGLNLFVAGWLVGGHSLNLWQRPRFDRAATEAHIRDTLSEPGSRVLISAIERIHQQFEGRFRQMGEERRHKTDLLTQETFDRNAFLAESKKERAGFLSSADEADQIVADALAQLSLEDRRKVAVMKLPPPFGRMRPPPPR